MLLNTLSSITPQPILDGLQHMLVTSSVFEFFMMFLDTSPA